MSEASTEGQLRLNAGGWFLKKVRVALPRPPWGLVQGKEGGVHAGMCTQGTGGFVRNSPELGT